MRRPVAVAILLPWLLIAGCDRSASDPVGIWADPFTIGPPSVYRQPKVYDTHRRSHDVWIVSDGKMIAVLAAACPHDDEPTYYDAMANQFRCPRCNARWIDMGVARSAGHGRPKDEARSLDRLHLDLAGDRVNPAAELRVSPRFRFSHEDGQWSHRFSLFLFDDPEASTR